MNHNLDEQYFLKKTPKEISFLAESHVFIRDLIQSWKREDIRWKDEHDIRSRETYQKIEEEIKRINNRLNELKCPVEANKLINLVNRVDSLSSHFWIFVIMLIGGSIVGLAIQAFMKHV